MSSAKAGIVLVLHAHLPYVRIPDRKFPLQELWLYHALTESYIPLILCFNDLINKNTDFNITLSLSPTLISMLSDDYYIRKYRNYLLTLKNLLEKKSSESAGDQKQSFDFLLKKTKTVSSFYKKINYDIISEIRSMSACGKINLITTSATHAILPLFRYNRDFIRKQIDTGIKVFANAFGHAPEGFWLPEMGYFTNLDELLRDSGIGYTFLDAHSIYFTGTSPAYGNFYPSTTGCLIVFPRDLPLSNHIWSSEYGYPGDFRYREFHYDYTYSLSDDELMKSGIDRVPFGLKIYRVTGNGKDKEFYNHEEAMQAVDSHSDDYILKIKERASIVSRQIDRMPVFTLPFDAELFGHWWYEGPEFLSAIIRKIACSGDLHMLSPADINKEEMEGVIPAESSWGRGGFFESWVGPESSWIYPAMAGLNARLNIIQNDGRAREQASKELLLASSSDWTFLISNKSSGDYGKSRLMEHIDSARKIISDMESGIIDEKFLSLRESLYPIF